MKDITGIEIKIDDIVCFYQKDSMYDGCYYLVTAILPKEVYPIKVWDYKCNAPNGWQPRSIRVIGKNGPLFKLVLK